MSERRALMLQLATNFQWLPYSYTNLYNSLVPTTISGKNVRNKAKVTKIYGNSEVANQQFNTFRTVSVNGCDITPLSNGRGIHIQGTAETTANTWVVNLGSNYTRFANHKMLIINKTNIVVRNNDFGRNKIEIGTITAQYFVVDMVANQVYNDDIELQLIDLTQECPFDTPTTLTDNRVQNILAQGYIPHNTGEINSVNMSEFSSEPYNLFDGELTNGRINSSGTFISQGTSSSAEYWTSTNFISTKGSNLFTIETRESHSNGVYISQYDKDQNFIGQKTYLNTWASRDFTLDNGCCYIKFTYTTANSEAPYIYVCFHRTSTRTGYAPHQTFTPITFKYQGGGVGTSHDTMEITSSEYVFTKDRALVDLSTLNWTTTSYGYSTQLTNAKPDNTNSIAEKYMYSSNFRTEANTWGWATNFIGINTTTTPTGTLEYQLATPQVTRIPKKHLGFVDLGSLDYGMSSAGRFYINASTKMDNVKIPSTQDEIANIYCEEYMAINGYQASNYSTNLAFGINPNGYLYIRDDSCSTIAELQAKLLNIYLWYETEDEVADIETKIGIQAGGTITSNSDVLPNVDFKMKAEK